MRERLERILGTIERPVVAMSGGVDSVTLGALAASLRSDVSIIHATSPAVPDEATVRVRDLAAQRGWQLTVLDAGEFSDVDYRANPVNRCFFCKSHLYGAIRRLTDQPILSGANLDDLGEYRPGLDAARVHGVRHPYVEAQFDKAAVRRLARALDLYEVAELPAAPCLSSRVETGIRIEPDTLRFIHAVERAVAERLGARTVRCRIRADAVVVELDRPALAALRDADRLAIEAQIAATPRGPAGRPVRFEAYRNGSAFLHGTAAHP